jgi:hypothetical protein
MTTKKKTTSRRTGTQPAVKPTRAELAKAATKHFPKLKLAAEKSLRQAGLRGVSIHAMTLDVDNGAVSDPCPQPCKPTEKCMFSPTLGRWVCVPI